MQRPRADRQLVGRLQALRCRCGQPLAAISTHAAWHCESCGWIIREIDRQRIIGEEQGAA